MKQITEDFVSFEIAKLLKEKGFDEYCLKNYWSDKELHNWKWELSYNKNSNANHNTRRYAAPTLQMTLKWLREVHSIYITSEPDINDKHCFYPVIYTMTEESWDIQCFEELEKLSFDKPEQAVEAALKYTLENLI